ncbi:MAG: hypothetical protein IJF67_02060 [Clostridia bacterium]|nr:hypothetical protein [Clostridia bacterium]
MKKRNLLGLLVLALLASACGQEAAPTTSDSTSPADDTTTIVPEVSYWDELGAKDFGGKTFTFLGVHYAARRNFADEEATGEIVNDALVERDNFIEEKFNVNFEFSIQASSGKAAPLAKNSVLAGEDNYNVVIDNIASALRPLMTENLLMNMNSLPTLDLSREWWSPGIYENTQLDGKIYVTMGDIAPQKYYAPYAVCYNQKLADEYKLPDMYDLVLSGNWTLAKFGELTKDVTHDLNGDSVINYDDFYAYAYVKTAITGQSHYVGAGGQLSKQEKGEIVIDIAGSRSIDIIEKVQSILDPTGIETYTNEIGNQTNKMFMSGRALFYGNSLSVPIAEFREMVDDFGIVPTPKYDAAQKDYYAYINTYCLGGVAVPKTVQDTEMTGFIMEALCYKSYEDVRPALCEVVIKQKVTREDANMQVMDIIFDNTYLDLNAVYDFGGSIKYLGESVVNHTDFMSGYAAIEPQIGAAIKTLTELLN